MVSFPRRDGVEPSMPQRRKVLLFICQRVFENRWRYYHDEIQALQLDRRPIFAPGSSIYIRRRLKFAQRRKIFACAARLVRNTHIIILFRRKRLRSSKSFQRPNMLNHMRIGGQDHVQSRLSIRLRRSGAMEDGIENGCDC